MNLVKFLRTFFLKNASEWELKYQIKSKLFLNRSYKLQKILCIPSILSNKAPLYSLFSAFLHLLSRVWCLTLNNIHDMLYISWKIEVRSLSNAHNLIKKYKWRRTQAI